LRRLALVHSREPYLCHRRRHRARPSKAWGKRASAGGKAGPSTPRLAGRPGMRGPRQPREEPHRLAVRWIMCGSGHVSAGALDTPLYGPEDALTHAHNHGDGYRGLVAEPGPRTLRGGFSQ
jgi:hypothetical protein